MFRLRRVPAMAGQDFGNHRFRRGVVRRSNAIQNLFRPLRDDASNQTTKYREEEFRADRRRVLLAVERSKFRWDPCKRCSNWRVCDALGKERHVLEVGYRRLRYGASRNG